MDRRQNSAEARAAGGLVVDRELASVGLSQKAGWYTAAWLYSGGATLFLLVTLLNPGQFQVGKYLLAASGYALAAFSIIGARRFENSDRAIHIRLVIGISTLFAGAALLGPERVSFALFTMFMLVTPALLYGPRFAVPYATYTIAFVFAAGLLTGDPFAKVWITCATLWIVAIGLMVARSRARRLATANTILANTDALTGVANTRRLHERLADQLGEPGTESSPFTLFALDLDNFKQVNDLFDHATGDRVLVAVADALEDLVDEDGLVARRGGDEFSLLVNGLDGPAAETLRDQIAAAIRLARLQVCPDVSPSASVAFVQSAPNDTIATLMRRADDALHAEKVAFHETHGASRPVPPGRPHLIDVSTSDEAESEAAQRHNDDEARAASTRASELAVDNANPVWMMTAAMLTPIGLVLASMAIPGLLRPLTPVIGALISLGFLALAGGCVIASRRNLRSTWLHVPFVLATGLLVAALLVADANGDAIADLLAVIGLYAFFYFRPGIAAIYLVGCLAIYAGFEIGGSYPYGVTRTAVSGISMLIVTIAVIKIRDVTIGFARRNRELSEIDSLTGVANIRSMKHRVNEAIANARDGATSPTLILLDLDEFKSVNDRYNHTAGDQMIAAVANAISETVRSEDFVARRGGDEFAVLCESLADVDRLVIVDRLQEAIVYARKRICPDLTASVSIAVVTSRPGQHADEFMRSADSALHDANERSRSGAGDSLRSSA